LSWFCFFLAAAASVVIQEPMKQVSERAARPMRDQVRVFPWAELASRGLYLVLQRGHWETSETPRRRSTQCLSWLVFFFFFFFKEKKIPTKKKINAGDGGRPAGDAVAIV
jgi:hypothetical protein